MGSLVAGVDLATQNVRVAVCDGDGVVGATGEAPLPPPRSPRPGWVEQDATEWWPATCAALRAATEKLGPASAEIAAVSVAATSGTVGLADEEGRPLGPALLYNDGRAEDEANAAQRAGRKRWDELGVTMSASWGLPKLVWLLRHSAGAERARRCRHASDVVVARLVEDDPPTDWSHALKSGYDVVRLQWPEEVLEELGVPPSLLPRVLPPTTPIGHVSARAAADTGLPRSCEVRLGMTDACAAQLAAGADRPDRYVSVLGTTFVVKGAARSLLKDGSGALYSHRHPDGWWLPGGASNTGGEALEEGFKGRDLSALDDAAAKAGPARCVAYPLARTGERFPFVAPRASGFVVGEPGDEVERYRATLEGVAFVERLAYAHLSSLGARIEAPVALSGAATRSHVWNRLRASVLDRQLVVAASGYTAFGSCLLAAAGTLHPDLSGARTAMVRGGEEVEPRRDEQAALERSYETFVHALADRGWIDERLREHALASPETFAGAKETPGR